MTVVFVLIIFFLCLMLYLQNEQIQKLRNEIKTQSTAAVNKSRAVLKGKISEQIAPFTKDFPFAASDCRFFGSPIDFIVIKGMSDESEEVEIFIVDIKTGDAKLNKIQRKIKKAVETNSVYFYEHRINIENL